MCAKATTAFAPAQWYSIAFPAEEEANIRNLAHSGAPKRTFLHQWKRFFAKCAESFDPAAGNR